MLELANALAWVVISALIAVAILVANRLGFVGLLILGLLTAFVCGHAELQDDVPTAGTAIFKARMERLRSPEEKYANAEEKRGFRSSLRFFKWCGLGLAAIGLIGAVLQFWFTGT